MPPTVRRAAPAAPEIPTPGPAPVVGRVPENGNVAGAGAGAGAAVVVGAAVVGGEVVADATVGGGALVDGAVDAARYAFLAVPPWLLHAPGLPPARLTPPSSHSTMYPVPLEKFSMQSK